MYQSDYISPCIYFILLYWTPTSCDRILVFFTMCNCNRSKKGSEYICPWASHAYYSPNLAATGKVIINRWVSLKPPPAHPVSQFYNMLPSSLFTVLLKVLKYLQSRERKQNVLNPPIITNISPFLLSFFFLQNLDVDCWLSSSKM